MKPWQITRYLAEGPRTTLPAPTVHEIEHHAADLPEKFDYAMIKLYYGFAESMFKKTPPGQAQKYRRFVESWIHRVDRPSSRFVDAAISVYGSAAGSGFWELSQSSPEYSVRSVIDSLPRTQGNDDRIGDLPALLLRGQAESLLSRERAAATFGRVRHHAHHDLVRSFTWDAGALSYYGAEHVLAKKQPPEQLVPEITWAHIAHTGHRTAFVVSVDPVFFRIYAPMMIFNAQQLPEYDLVLLLCADKMEAADLVADAEAYNAALCRLNTQPRARNISFFAVDKPEWVVEDHAYYACARFFALPQLLEHYENVYCLDADLLLKDNPASFFKATADVPLSVPLNSGALSLIPWRRYMAGNLVANRRILETPALQDLAEYISVGLRSEFAWTLDQNALSYVAERSQPSTMTPLNRYARPTVVSSFMTRWERNHKIRSARTSGA